MATVTTYPVSVPIGVLMGYPCDYCRQAWIDCQCVCLTCGGYIAVDDCDCEVIVSVTRDEPAWRTKPTADGRPVTALGPAAP